MWADQAKSLCSVKNTCPKLPCLAWWYFLVSSCLARCDISLQKRLSLAIFSILLSSFTTTLLLIASTPLPTALLSFFTNSTGSFLAVGCFFSRVGNFLPPIGSMTSLLWWRVLEEWGLRYTSDFSLTWLCSVWKRMILFLICSFFLQSFSSISRLRLELRELTLSLSRELYRSLSYCCIWEKEELERRCPECLAISRLMLRLALTESILCLSCRLSWSTCQDLMCGELPPLSLGCSKADWRRCCLRCTLICWSLLRWAWQSCWCWQSWFRGGTFIADRMSAGRALQSMKQAPGTAGGNRVRDLSAYDEEKAGRKERCGWAGRFYDWFKQLSVLKKIILIFTLNTLFLLIIINVVMMVIFGNITDDIIRIADQEKDQFNLVSNRDVAEATAKRILAASDRQGQMLYQLVRTYNYFQVHPNFYSSLESSSPQLPKLTSDYSNASYTEVGYYYLNNQSAFTPLPYVDEALSRQLRTSQQQQITKRMTVFVVNESNSEDLTARTVPATDTFTIPNASTITQRFAGITEGQMQSTVPYTDLLTTQSDPVQLFAFRTVLASGQGFSLYMEIQLYRFAYLGLQETFYFSSSQIFIVQQVNSSYVFSSYNSQDLTSHVAAFYPIGIHQFSVDGVDYWASSVGVTNTFSLGQVSTITNSSSDPLRCIVAVKAEQTSKPALTISEFLNFELLILTLIVVFWSGIILLSTLALSAVVGNYIFSNLQTLCSKMEEYIHKPQDFHQILIELKELSLKGILKQLSDSLLAIIEKIEVRKRERKDRINQNTHPSGMGDEKFQERQQLNDYHIIERVKMQAQEIVEQVKRQREIQAEQARRKEEQRLREEERRIEEERLEQLRKQIAFDSESDPRASPQVPETPEGWNETRIKISPPIWPPTPRQLQPPKGIRAKSMSLAPPPLLNKREGEEMEAPMELQRSVTPTTLEILESLNRIPEEDWQAQEEEEEEKKERDNSEGRMFKKKPYRKSK